MIPYMAEKEQQDWLKKAQADKKNSFFTVLSGTQIEICAIRHECHLAFPELTLWDIAFLTGEISRLIPLQKELISDISYFSRKVP